MRIAYTPEQEELRRELRSYFASVMTPTVREALAAGEGDYGNGEAYRQVVRQLGKDGWLALSWPPEYGGRGGGALRQPDFPPEGGGGRGAGPVPSHINRGRAPHRARTSPHKGPFLSAISARAHVPS